MRRKMAFLRENMVCLGNHLRAVFEGMIRPLSPRSMRRMDHSLQQFFSSLYVVADCPFQAIDGLPSQRLHGGALQLASKSFMKWTDVFRVLAG